MFDEASKPLRWFLLPSEAADCLQGNQSQNALHLPFCPPDLSEHLGLPVFQEQHVEAEVTLKDMLEENVKHEQTAVTIGIKSVNDKQKEELQDRIKDNDDNAGGSDVVVDYSKHGVNVNKTDEKSCSEGLQNCLDKGFSDSNTVNKTCSDKPVCDTDVDISEEFDIVSKQVKDLDCKANEDCNIDQDSSNSIKQVNLAGDSQKRITKCDTNLCENTNICRKRPAETECIGSVCTLPVKRTKDEVHVDGKVDENAAGGNVKDKKHSGRKSKTKKEGTRWFSPPKTIFTPFLKVWYKFY
jgi:hypothetical protein